MIVAEVVLAVVTAGVDAAIAKRQAARAALGSVVVDNVEQDFDAIAVQLANRCFNLVQDRLRPGLDCTLAGIAVVRGKEVDRVVSPIVEKPHVQQVRLRDDLVYRQQLYRGNANLLQMRDCALVGQGSVGAPNVVWQVGVATGQPASVSLVDHNPVERHVWLGHALPVEAVVNGHAVVLARRFALDAAGIGVD